MMMPASKSNEIEAIYQQLLEAWNNRDGRGMADLFAVNGESIGFDGSQSIGPEEIFSYLKPIFRKTTRLPGL
jgi:uncharacterized protein (TIGR02246 family)